MRDHKSTNDWPDTLPSQFGPYDIDEVPETHRAPAEHPQAPEPGLPVSAPAPSHAPPQRLAWARWVAEGLRAALLKTPRTGAAAPSPLQALVLVLLCSVLLLGLERLHTPGPAVFQLGGWVSHWWAMLVLIGAAWWAIPAAGQPADGAQPQRPAGLAAWLMLSSVAVLPPLLILYGLMALGAHWPAWWSSGQGYWGFWGIYGAMMLAYLLIHAVLMQRFTRSGARTAVFMAVLLAVTAIGMYYVPTESWAAAPPSENAPRPARLHLSQAVFESQQDLMQQQSEALTPERPGVTDVYGLVFAPYARENVFRRESTMVAKLLQERFDAQGRVLHLLNHAETADTHVWATPENLEDAVNALAARMDKDNDVLVVYMTSHGAQNHQLAASHWPLEVPPISPEMLREALDAAGIRHRVIAISACYSGGWIDTLANPSTLIMTAADATHTSYGCGALSELTFFGRAVFDEQLRSTHSFEDAFRKAVPLIQQREVEAGKSDGFSNPQIRVGAEIAPVLQRLEERLNAAPR